MKKSKFKNVVDSLTSLSKGALSLGLIAFGLSVNGQTTYTFTNAGATGRLGPTQAQLNAAYAATNLNGLVGSLTQGVQTITVPQSGMYRIEAWGASGGMVPNLSGFGARVAGDVYLTGGSVLSIIVGQMGSSYGPNNSDGGGGGSFVAENGTLVIAAGGGGGAAQQANSGQDARVGTTVASPNAEQFGSSGASFSANGVHFFYGIYTTVAQSFINGGNGQAGGQAGGWPGGTYGEGGFGGGGSSCSCSTGGGGGGGGFVGGGGGGCCYFSGNGGSSYIVNTAVNTSSNVLNSFGHGRVLVTPLCNVGVSASSNPICEGNSVTLSTDAVSNISWSEAGQTSSSIVVSPSVTTTYSVTGTSTANCITTAMITVSVNPLPVINVVTSPSVVCVGGTASLSAGGAATYAWSSGDAGANITLSPSMSSVLTVTGTSAAGCTSTLSVPVTVNTNSISISPSTSICAGSTINISASGVNSYTWSNGSLFQSIPVSPATGTVYSVSGTDVHNCVLSNSVSVGVNPLPNVTASANRQMLCKGEAVTLTGGGASTYTWNNGDTGAQVTYTLSVDVPYYYSVTGVDVNGCANTATASVLVSACTGIEEALPANGVMSIFPNPGKGIFSVNVARVNAGTSVNIYNAVGALVASHQVSGTRTMVDLSHEANGVYFVRLLENGKEIYTGKLIKE